MLKKCKDSLLFVLVSAIILGVTLASLLAPDKTFSENENKVLAQLPKPSFATLLNGKFTADYETYVADQFPLRDEWIAGKSVSEFLLLKTENNGVAYGRDGYMFPKYLDFSASSLQKNLEAVRTFAQSTKTPVTLLAVPSAYAVLTDKVPAGLPGADETAQLQQVRDTLAGDVGYVDVRAVLAAHKEDYIYYRTDHHWTTLGAYYAYEALAQQLPGGVRFRYDESKATAVGGFLGTSYSKCKAFNAVPDTIRYFPALTGTLTTTQSSGTHTYDSLYNTEQFTKRDKYSGFLYGNSSYVEIKTAPRADKLGSVLILRDSYADSLVPYLTEHYERIVLVDPRYYNGSYRELAAQGFDDILLVFGFEDLASPSTKLTQLGLA